MLVTLFVAVLCTYIHVNNVMQMRMFIDSVLERENECTQRFSFTGSLCQQYQLLRGFIVNESPALCF